MWTGSVVAGLAAALGAGTVWGLTPALYLRASRSGGSIRANAWKSLGGLAGLSIPWLAFGAPLPGDPVSAGLIALAALFGGGFGDYAYFRGLARVGPSRATPIGYTYMLWTSLASLLIYGEPPTVNQAVGMILALAGIWLISQDGEGGRWDAAGVAWSLAASASWALSPIAIRGALERVAPAVASFWNSLFLAVGFAAAAALGGGMSCDGWAESALGGLLGIGLGVTLYYYGVEAAGVNLTVLANSVTPVVSQAAGWAAGEPPTRRVASGAALVALGLAAGVL